MSGIFKFDEKVESLSAQALRNVESRFSAINEISEYNQQKMLKAFIDNGVSETMFAESTGYGYDDRGREVIDRVFAQAVDAEDSIVRHNFTCGTHTLAVALFGVLRTGDTMLCVTGTPYDTIHSVIGLKGEGMGSLRDYGINYRQVELKENGKIDLEKIEEAVDESIKMVYIQRSRGYSLRDSLSVKEIGDIVKVSKKKNKNVIVMVDNCYGEFVEKLEPTSVGADLIAGSLIKNPGGAIAKTGGYIAGRHDLVEMCAYRMTTPGLGREVGATLGHSRELFMGIYNAPAVVGESVKTAVFACELFRLMGFGVTPEPEETRHDIIQAIKLENEKNLIAFCQGLQKGAPIDSFVTPVPSPMPGYDSQVIMSAGAFTLGSSIELSADAPLREPYAVWLQGGINFGTSKIGIMLAAQEVLRRNNE
ncbi:MAG: aminotransferase class I/II-fold pyridoxal phosphate-dependent enzyme [Ruminococcaceae bacterium]|nr:aminotransferase class I/II-fold pyridoxal phosphate-dependent enzyme [Oscillospiraceae bacterium]